MNEIDKLEKEIKKVFKDLSNVSLPKKTIMSIKSVIRRNSELRIEINRINELIEKRCKNIKQHKDIYYVDHRIPYKIHNEYHSITEELISAYKNMFSKQTQLLHQVVLVFETLLKHEDKRELKFKSFGSFAGSILKTNTIFSKKFIEMTIFFSEKYLVYRDKHIEHFKMYEDEENFLPMKFESRGNFNTFSLIEKYSLPNENHIPISIERYVQNLVSTNEEYLEVVQMINNKKNKEDCLYIHAIQYDPNPYKIYKKGEVIGKNYIGNESHLEMYGIHSHLFYNTNDEIEDLYKSDSISPDFLDTIIDTLSFIKVILCEIIQLGRKIDYKD